MTGSCLCGEVKFAVELPSKWCAHCHCTLCQKAHAAAFVTWVGFPTAQFQIVRGQDHVRRHKSSDSGRRCFCDLCGSQLFFESSRWPDEIHVPRALLEGDLDKPPMAHVFYDSHTPWMELNDGLPRCGGSTGTELLPVSET